MGPSHQGLCEVSEFEDIPLSVLVGGALLGQILTAKHASVASTNLTIRYFSSQYIFQESTTLQKTFKITEESEYGEQAVGEQGKNKIIHLR